MYPILHSSVLWYFQNVLGPYSFIVFIFIILGFGIFFYMKLPETKNRTYDDIFQIFNKSSQNGAQKNSHNNNSVVS